MTINWYPGHMSQARRALRDRLKRSDMVLEVLDARLPRSSQNPMLASLRGALPCLRVLTKPDLADPSATALWVTELAKDGATVLPLDATNKQSAKVIVRECRKLVPNRGKPGFPVRVTIVGIPNVGKSTIFNTLVGKKKAVVRDQPAVTRQQQRVEVPGGLWLVDTPGVLWPKLNDQVGAQRLAISGAIRNNALDLTYVARFAVAFMRERYASEFAARFGLVELPEDPDALLEAVAQRRGCLTRGVGLDLAKASEIVLGEIRAGQICRISFETPADFEGLEADSTSEPPLHEPD